jgi:hypothetical protein
MKIDCYDLVNGVIIFGPEREVSKYVMIYFEEIGQKKIMYWPTLKEKYETIIRRLKYLV